MAVANEHESDSEDSLTANSNLLAAVNNGNSSAVGVAAAAVPGPPASPSSLGGASSSTARHHHQQQQQSQMFSTSNVKHELMDRLPVSHSIFTPQVCVISFYLDFSMFTLSDVGRQCCVYRHVTCF